MRLPETKRYNFERILVFLAVIFCGILYVIIAIIVKNGLELQSLKKQAVNYIFGVKYDIAEDTVKHRYKIQSLKKTGTNYQKFFDCENSYISTKLDQKFFATANLDKILCSLNYKLKEFQKNGKPPTKFLNKIVKDFVDNVNIDSHSMFSVVILKGKKFTIHIVFRTSGDLHFVDIYDRYAGKTVDGFFFRLPFTKEVSELIMNITKENTKYLLRYLSKTDKTILFGSTSFEFNLFISNLNPNLQTTPLTYHEILLKNILDYILNYYK